MVRNTTEIKLNTVTDEATAISASRLSDVDTLPTIKNHCTMCTETTEPKYTLYLCLFLSYILNSLPEGTVVHVWLAGLGIQDPLL